MVERSIIVIGAGMAGLGAGCYGQMSGYRTQIFEQHTAPGGLCTAWQRKGYTFDGCLHWLIGSGRGKMMHQMWQDLGALEGTKVIDFDTFYVFHSADGRTFHCYVDPDRLKTELLGLFPAERPVVEEVVGAVRSAKGYCEALDAMESGNAVQKARYLPRLASFPGYVKKWDGITVRELSAKAVDPFLGRAFLGYFPESMGAFFFLFNLGFMADKNAGVPQGGSLAFARRIEKRYRDLGGHVSYGARVSEILVEGDTAVGVRLIDGTEHLADWVISAADGYSTIYKMLGGRYLSPEVEAPYNGDLEVFPSTVQVSFGLDMDLSCHPPQQVWELDSPSKVGLDTLETIGLHHYCFDPCFAPTGKSVGVALFRSRLAPWQAMHDQGAEAYDACKEQVAAAVADLLDARVPGFKRAIEVSDVVTPVTYQRYTSNWQGSVQGWIPRPGTFRMDDGDVLPHTLPGLERFHMTGQWVAPGGGVPVAGDAKKVIQRICRTDGQDFHAGR
jgi:phytoene dehydrogenase-like protein